MSEEKEAPRIVTKEQWEDAIRTARQYVNSYSDVRWLIAELALEVCTLYHGGRVHKTTFTISKFAEEIGLNHKTLLEWTRVKRYVIDKLPVTIQDKAQKIPYKTFRGVMDSVNETTTSKEVYKRYKEYLAISPDIVKFNKYEKHLKTILFNAQRPVIMQDVPEETILRFISTCEVISKLLARELEFRKKWSANEARFAPHPDVKAMLAKRIQERDEKRA